MTRYPELKVTHWIDGQSDRTMLEFDQARDFLFSYDVLVVVEGTAVRNFEELMELAARVEHRDKAFLEVSMETFIGGG